MNSVSIHSRFLQNWLDLRTQLWAKQKWMTQLPSVISEFDCEASWEIIWIYLKRHVIERQASKRDILHGSVKRTPIGDLLLYLLEYKVSPSAPGTHHCYSPPPSSRHLKRKRKKEKCHVIVFISASEHIVKDSSELLKIHKEARKKKPTDRQTVWERQKTITTSPTTVITNTNTTINTSNDNGILFILIYSFYFFIFY